MPRRKTQQEFISQVLADWGDAFNLDKANYKGNKIKLEITCNACNTTFLKNPDKLHTGEGCPICSEVRRKALRASTTDKFIAKANEVHGQAYDYELVDYLNNYTKVTVKCNTCAQLFQANPNNHLNGRGCPNCAKTGYKRSRPGHLYIMKCGDITKIGITNLDITIRVKDISRSFGSTFSVQTTWSFEDGAIADDIETSILRTLRTKYSRPQAKFEGSSECFLNVDYEELVNLINNEIETLSETTP